ncbi:MAG: hypothetical protein K2I04_05095 [Muribaculaceae bacterium]|nr:hypothetical protein [Muribaculaceae bacterium]
MTLLRLPIIAIAAALLLCCCADRRGADALLDHADTLLFSAPADAVALLDSLPDADLDDARAARRAVLLAKARSKAYQPISPDSSLIAAVNHYEGSDDSLAVQALFYLGEAQYDEKDYAHALLTLNDAYDKAENSGEHFYAGMAARILSLIYHDILSVEQDLKWALKSKEEFCAAGKTEHAAWNIYIICSAYSHNNMLQEALTALKEAEQSDYATDEAFSEMLSKLKADIMLRAGEYDSCTTIYQRIIQQGCNLSPTEWCKLSEAFLYSRDYISSHCALDSAIAYSTNELDSLYTSHISALLAGREGDYYTGYELAMDWGLRMTDHVEQKLMYPQTILLSENYRLKAENGRATADSLRMRLILVITLSAIAIAILAAACILIYRNYIRKREDAEVRVLRISQLEKNLNNSLSLSSELNEALKKLLREKIHITQRLNEINFNSDDNISSLRLLSKSIDRITTSQSADFNRDLSLIIDKCADNWASRFMSDFPTLNQDMQTLAMYLFLDFSFESIAGLMNKPSIKAVYNDKHRLKKAMLQANNERAIEVFPSMHIHI